VSVRAAYLHDSGPPPPEWAADQVAELLGPLGDRWHHVQGVVATAQRVGRALPGVEGRWLELAAYLHDIGYTRELIDTGFHAIDGARWLRRGGHDRLAGLVAHHSGARFEAIARGLGPAIAAFEREESPTADALTYCDLTTSSTGAPVTVAQRMADIASRYGETHYVTTALRLAMPSLLLAVNRTEDRLALAGIPSLRQSKYGLW